MVKVGFFQMSLWCLSELQTLVQNMLNFTKFLAWVHNSMFRKSWVRLLFDQSGGSIQKVSGKIQN